MNFRQLFSTLFPFLLVGCLGVHSEQKLISLPQDPLVQVYFNHTESSQYQESLRQQQRKGDDLEQQIIEAISTSKSSVDVAVQELRLPKIAQALGERQKAGVKVRVILENTYNYSLGESQPGKTAREAAKYDELRKLSDRNQDGKISVQEAQQGDALLILRNAKVPVIDDTADGSKGSDLMHHKFIVVDDRTIIVTSANFTSSDIHGDLTNPDSTGNANNLVKIDSPELAAIFTQEFNLMWNGDRAFGLKKPFRPPQQVQVGNITIDVQFSPTSSTSPFRQSTNGLIAKTLSTSSQSVDLALFVFSDQNIANTLEQQSLHNVKIRAVIEPDFIYRPYSEALDMMGVSLSNKCKYEANNHPWLQPITTVGVPQLFKGDLLHHKFAVIDKSTVITGSHNWSESANTSNDENLLVIHSLTVAAHYQQEFERLYSNAQLGVSERLQQKIQKAQKQCVKG
ncbi:phospholipase D-like domain-containing protein [Synechocystis sp. PCC 7509]|uniref:phospholipase D-like domain-containing protein n=1 Tax=Synechocystis sp. PCC 7509 TaxID=927677 RepID=UPI0002AB9FD5|nr:phospholipase D-like domain-containing protein [Synechocystis sp. PCC 7509]